MVCSKAWGFALFISGVVCSGSYAATVNNPLMWVDVPDVSIVRADDTYYMVSTTMHVAPGVPVMASKDLAQWRTVGYAYQTLTDNDNQNLENGKNAYGKGSWASSIRYHDGYFYVLTPSYTTGKTHLYKTKDVASDNWQETILPFYHDPSLFFDDDGTVWVFYGNSPISYVQLNDDASGVMPGGKSGTVGGTNVEPVAGNNYIVKQEGAHMEKVNGEYYLYTISWPSGKCRTSIVYRSKNLLDGFTGRIFLQDNGVAQGSFFDTPDGKWYTLLFRDSGPVGRIPYLVPTSWENGWPVADGGKAPATLDLPNEVEPGYGLVTSDEFDSDELPLEWQWNHNPDHTKWKISDGKLNITTGRVDSKLYNVKNTLTQRTFGPKCSGRTFVDGSNMKDGDIAGIVALQDSMGYVGLSKNGGSYEVVYYKERSDGKHLIKSEAINTSSVYLRVDFDMPLDRGSAMFYYSIDGKSWNVFSDKLNLYYTLGMFVGYRIGLFNMATKAAGGTASFDWYKIGSDINEEIYLDAGDPVPQTPFGDKAWAIPGKIEMEDFDEPGKGKGGASYYDGDEVNHSCVDAGKEAECSDYREGTGVDIYKKGDKLVVGYNTKGDWLEYTVNVEKSGDYTLFAAVAAAGEGGKFKLSVDGEDITDEISVPAATTGEDNFDEFNKVKANVELEAGVHILRFTVTGDWFDIDYINFVEGKNAEDTAPIDNVENPDFVKESPHFVVTGVNAYHIFDLKGNRLGTFYAEISDLENVTREFVRNAGVYIVKPVQGGYMHKVSVTK